MKFTFSFGAPITVSAMLMVFLTSCGDIEQHLQINADGSGTLETTFDIGEMMGMMNGFGEPGAADVTVSDDESPDTTMAMPEEPADPMKAILDKITDPEHDRDFDTLISFLNIMPDSVREKQTRPDLINRLSLRLRSPAKSADLLMGLVMKFDNPAQLQELVNYMDTMDNSGNVVGAANPTGLESETFLLFEADMKAGWIRFDSVDYSGAASGLGLGMSSDSLMNSDDMGMIEMMFGSSKIKSIIQVPGDVTSCTNKEAILTKDNKVIIEYGLLEAMKKGKVEGYTIYFTPGK